MSVAVVGPADVIDGWLRQRRALGHDSFDEVRDGVHHLAPPEHARNTYLVAQLTVLLDPAARTAGLRITGPFNLGAPDDYRIPDLGLHVAPVTWQLYMSSAAVVVEVLSPEDETEAKLDFYAACGVREVWVVDPARQALRCLRLTAGAYVDADASGVLAVILARLHDQLDWG